MEQLMKKVGHQVNIEAVKNGFIITLGNSGNRDFFGNCGLYNPEVATNEEGALEIVKRRIKTIRELTRGEIEESKEKEETTKPERSGY